MKHEIIIERDYTKTEEYAKEGDNLGEIWIIGPAGKRIINSEYRVQFFLSKNGLIGFGTALIRAAYKFREGSHWHLEPISKNNVVQDLGIYMTPKSDELIICCDDLGKLDDYIK